MSYLVPLIDTGSQQTGFIADVAFADYTTGVTDTISSPGFGVMISGLELVYYVLEGALSAAQTGITTSDVVPIGDHSVSISESGFLTSGATGINLTGAWNHVVMAGALVSGADGLRMIGEGASATISGWLQAAGNGIMARGNYAELRNTGNIGAGATGVHLEGDYAGLRNNAAITTSDTGVYVSGGASWVDNDGTISARLSGVIMEVDDGTLLNSGHIDAGARAVELRGDNFEFTNAGTIYTPLLDGIAVWGHAPTLRNSGLIQTGIVIDSPSGTAVLENTGQILHSVTSTHNKSTVTLDNFGKIGGDILLHANGNIGAHVIRNDGVILGEVRLGAGDDDYWGSGSVGFAVHGGDGDDALLGSHGKNRLYGGNHDDFLMGRRGDDVLNGGGGDDGLQGGQGNDLLIGGAGADYLSGDSGQDRIFGGMGEDRIIGGGGDDTLAGGGNRDVFVFFGLSGHDTITDFRAGRDRIELQGGDLSPADFESALATALSDLDGVGTLLDLNLLGGAGTVILNGVAAAELDASDFIL